MIQDPLSQAGIEFRFITCAFNSLFTYLSFVIWYISSAYIYCIMCALKSSWIFTSLQSFFNTYNVISFPNTWIHLLLRRRINMKTIFTLLQVSLFFRLFYSFTHAIAFLFVARPHMWDIRRVLIMLLDRRPLSSPFHEIPARGGTTYYVPGAFRPVPHGIPRRSSPLRSS